MRVSSIGSFIVSVLVAAAIIAALWLAGMAVYEDVRFELAKSQIFSLIGLTREEAKDPELGLRTGGDLLVDLARRGKIAGFDGEGPVQLTNSWRRPVRLMAVSPNDMAVYYNYTGPGFRLETEVPAHACRRLALFFGQGAKDVKLQAMEAREENSHWRTFFKAPEGKTLGDLEVNAACGIANQTTLALILQLH